MLEFFLYPDLLKLDFSYLLFRRPWTSQWIVYCAYWLLKKLLCTELLQGMGGREKSGSLSVVSESRTSQCRAAPTLPLEKEAEWKRPELASLLLAVLSPWTLLLIELHLHCTLSRLCSQVLTNGWLLFLVSEPLWVFVFSLVFMCILTGNGCGHVTEFELVSSFFRSQPMTICKIYWFNHSFDSNEMSLDWTDWSQRF